MKNTLNKPYLRVVDIVTKHPLTAVVVITIVFLVLGYFFLKVKNRDSINTELKYYTKVAESMWKALTTAHEETTLYIFKHYVMTPQVFKILKKANSPNRDEQNLARAELFTHLWDSYQYLCKNLYARQFHFHLPNNHSFLRFHAPEQHSDDLTPYRPCIVKANKEKNLVLPLKQEVLF
jgi:uncharacterized protein with PQ loop repeat